MIGGRRELLLDPVLRPAVPKLPSVMELPTLLLTGGDDGGSDPAVRIGNQLDGVDTLAGAHRSLVELLALTQYLPPAAGDGWALTAVWLSRF